MTITCNLLLCLQSPLKGGSTDKRVNAGESNLDTKAKPEKRSESARYVHVHERNVLLCIQLTVQLILDDRYDELANGGLYFRMAKACLK